MCQYSVTNVGPRKELHAVGVHAPDAGLRLPQHLYFLLNLRRTLS